VQLEVGKKLANKNEKDRRSLGAVRKLTVARGDMRKLSAIQMMKKGGSQVDHGAVIATSKETEIQKGDGKRMIEHDNGTIAWSSLEL